ncbi:MFS transporter [Sinomonas sp. R1AF57]|uniref:MFS transporter n=1 Tax=Sinomonas sp. R1AF57 TaxID=2020377 RepID=UPI000B60F7F9|nr:MFS transporter [Sinomonas sp. R1AF57]ASN51597.1 MFS transporter [Sinomonas sp. R1AF57]
MAAFAASAGRALENPDARRGLWKGRGAVIVGLVLLGIGLRYAITGMSPLLSDVRAALGIDTAGATLLGMLPTLSFGVGGFLAPALVRRWGPEATALIAVVLAAVGALLRPFGGGTLPFLGLTAVALVGMGLGNVAGAPLVKKYFPDRQASMITLFSLLMQAGATLPAMTALPLANTVGWQGSLASWGLLSLIAVLPWAAQFVASLRARHDAGSGTRVPTSSAPKVGFGELVRSPVAWGTAVFYAMASLNTYAMLAWLPTILAQYGGLSKADAAGAFSIFTFMTLPMAVVTPLLANRLRNPTWLAVALAATLPAGYLGLLSHAGPAWVWVFVAGISGGAFPFAIAMFNLRTRTTAGSAGVGGFAMGIGYLAGTLGPLVGGGLFAATGGWAAPLWVYVATFVPMALGAVIMARPGRYVEDALGTPSPEAGSPATVG